MLLKALADELPVESIRFSSKITSLETQTHEGSKLAIVRMEDGAIIKAKVTLADFGDIISAHVCKTCINTLLSIINQKMVF